MILFGILLPLSEQLFVDMKSSYGSARKIYVHPIPVSLSLRALLRSTRCECYDHRWRCRTTCSHFESNALRELHRLEHDSQPDGQRPNDKTFGTGEYAYKFLGEHVPRAILVEIVNLVLYHTRILVDDCTGFSRLFGWTHLCNLCVDTKVASTRHAGSTWRSPQGRVDCYWWVVLWPMHFERCPRHDCVWFLVV